MLKNTLSDNGSVTRGICSVDADGYLCKVEETRNIEKTAAGAVARSGDGSVRTLNAEACVSMNMWGLMPEFLDILNEGFPEFLKQRGQEMTSEYLLPDIIDQLIRQDAAKVKLLKTPDQWFGVTYKEDKQTVVEAIARLIAQGKYPARLFG